jgi:Icc protein
MPIHLPPTSRRRFLKSAAAAGAGLLAPDWLGAQERREVDPDRVALFADTHVAADQALVARDVNMAEHFRRACAAVAALDVRPAHLLVCGDFAYSAGESADYATAVKLIELVRAAGVPIHVALGNHDHRERFWAAVAGSRKPKAPVNMKHLAVIDTPRARWILLDSLHETLEVRGRLGDQQLTWLGGALDADAKKPAIVMVHHNPEIGDAAGKKGGLADTEALLNLLGSRRQAKALFFGHSHRWTHEQRPDGLHLVNLPATAYVFQPEQPSGWVDARLADDGVSLTLCTLDPKHPLSGQRRSLTWRNA